MQLHASSIIIEILMLTKHPNYYITKYLIFINDYKISKILETIKKFNRVAGLVVCLLDCSPLYIQHCLPLGLTPILFLIFTNNILMHLFNIQIQLNKFVINLHNILLHIY